ncbi:anti-repressor SinI family protein [Bacillus rubiinfantis]|nr:anti-repressor SinI family protein [Bacillus rubiinfantis]
MIVQENEVEVMDLEWLALIVEAKEMGLTVEEVQIFLKQNESTNKS